MQFHNRVIPSKELFLLIIVLLVLSLLSNNTLGALPNVDSDVKSKISKIMLVAALGDSGVSTLGSQLRDYRVKRPRVEDYEFTAAVLAIMMKKIDTDQGRERTIVKLNRATPGQKALFAVQVLRLTVTEFGFIGYFESSYANLIPEAKRGLKILGAKEYLRVFEQALAIFYKSKTLITNIKNRKNILDRLSNEEKYNIFDPVDQKFEAMEDETILQNYIIKYVNNNPTHFFAN